MCIYLSIYLPGGLVCFPLIVPWPALCVCVRKCVLPYCSSCLWYIWNSNHILGTHACFLVSLCLLFASVGQASARPIASLPLFTSLLTHGRVLLCIDAHCFIFWDLPGDVLAAPESALGLDRCNTSLSLSLCVGLLLGLLLGLLPWLIRLRVCCSLLWCKCLLSKFHQPQLPFICYPHGPAEMCQGMSNQHLHQLFVACKPYLVK